MITNDELGLCVLMYVGVWWCIAMLLCEDLWWCCVWSSVCQSYLNIHWHSACLGDNLLQHGAKLGHCAVLCNIEHMRGRHTPKTGKAFPNLSLVHVVVWPALCLWGCQFVPNTNLKWVYKSSISNGLIVSKYCVNTSTIAYSAWLHVVVIHSAFLKKQKKMNYL